MLDKKRTFNSTANISTMSTGSPQIKINAIANKMMNQTVVGGFTRAGP